MRVLIVEDNEPLAKSMAASLCAKGMCAETTNIIAEASELLSYTAYDVVLLDLNLPDGDGLDVLRELRAREDTTPVIAVTARDAPAQRTGGLDLGADDYVVKPFDLDELAARIRAVARRARGRANPTIEVAGLRIDPATRQATALATDQAVPLTAREFDILEELASRAPHVVSESELIEHVWGDSLDPFSSVVRVHMSRLRTKLRAALGHDALKTVRGKGWSLCDE